ncbi:MAG TPA: hypothetical protein VMZ28_25075 [Kofleriaceae bacterium]|nr:hypothetical protein [Kofleriaceae bacterium]
MPATARLVLAVLGVTSALSRPVAAQPEPPAPDAAPTAAPAAAPAPTGSMGHYERAALAIALRDRKLRLQPEAAGKRVRRIHVVNLDVFGEEEGFLTWFNIFHVTSREHVVEREVLLRPGETWDEEVVDESRRKLRDSLFTTLVVIEPVVAEGGAPDEVDLLVVTRDIWSLRMNSRYEIQDGVVTELSLSLSENNLLGYRKQVAVVFDMNLGSFTLGPQYVDKNIAGTRLTLVAKADAVFTRGGNPLGSAISDAKPEGSRSYLLFGYPLWSLRTPWGAAVEARHFDGVARAFGPGPRLASYLYDPDGVPDSGDEVLLPYEYDERDLEIESTVTRQLGDSVKHRVSTGHFLDVQRPEVRNGFPSPEARDAFKADVLPRSERSSSLFLRWTMFTPIYRVYRNIDSFDLSEDQRLGPELSAEVSQAIEAIGSEVDFTTGSASAAWTFDVAGDGVLRASTGASGRRQDGELIDKQVSGTLTGVSPAFLFTRLAFRTTWSRRYDETNNRTFSLGGDSGLRGYAIGEFRTNGSNPLRVLTNVELRTLPLRVLFTRAGLIAFWDAGHAANCYEGCDRPLSIHHDVGLGARALVPQLQPYVFRFDWAVPLNGVNAGLPGRFIFGVQQIF